MRVFVAIEIPAEIRAKLSEVCKDIPNLRLVGAEMMHVTVSFLGEIKSADGIAEAVKSACAGFKPFEASCVGVGVFPNERSTRVVWTGIENGKNEVAALSKKLNKILAKDCNLRAEDENTPHITLARIRLVDENTQKLILKLIGECKGKLFGNWKVREVLVIKSTLTPSGPVYETIKEVDL